MKSDILSKGQFSDESLISYFPQTLGYAQSSANILSTSPPRNLHESFLHSLYAHGEFDNHSEDIQNLATCLIHGINTPSEMKKIWPRFTELRYQKLKVIISTIVRKKMPWWARRFDKIWNKLSDAQAEAISLEWFYEGDEKPSQLENSAKIGITVASYQERLGWAYQKIEELYPELSRIKRRNSVKQVEIKPSKFFEILPDGSRIELPLPISKEKLLSSSQRAIIKKWSKQSYIVDVT